MVTSIRIMRVLLIVSLAWAGLALTQYVTTAGAEDQESRTYHRRVQSEPASGAKARDEEAEAAWRPRRDKDSKVESRRPRVEELTQRDRLLGEYRSLGIRQARRLVGSAPEAMVVIIPGDEDENFAEELVMIIEDMDVMCRIFDKKLGSDIVPRVRNIGKSPFVTAYVLGSGTRATEGIYLQGYGALFLMEAGFPLSRPPGTDEEEQIREDFDPLWEQTRQEIHGWNIPSEWTGSGKYERTKYDADKVKEFRTQLIRALKHATNIRSLQPDQWVIVTVTGSRESGSLTSRGAPDSNRLYYEQRRRMIGTPPAAPRGDVGYSWPAVMTIRAKKSEVDAFAKGELDFEQFCGKVRVVSY